MEFAGERDFSKYPITDLSPTVPIHDPQFLRYMPTERHALCEPGYTIQSRGVLILGMHRSGTSSLAGCLQERGLFLGEVSEKNPFNPQGNRENQAVMELNKSVLESSGGRWNAPPERISWTPGQEHEREAIVAFFSNSGAQLWGFKDPRTLLTLPFWEAGIARVLRVGTFRHPATVAKSLAARSGMPIDRAFTLWRFYNQKLVEAWETRPFPLVCFDSGPREYLDAIERAASHLGLGTHPGTTFFEENLRNQAVSTAGLPEPGETELAIYSQLCRMQLECF